MVRKTTAPALLPVLLLVAVLLAPAAAGAEEPGARTERTTLGFGILGGVAVASDPDGYPPEYSEFFTPKAQAVGALSGLLDVPLFSPLALGIALQLHGTTISNYSGGWVYRSHWGGALRLSASCGLGLTGTNRPLRLKLGASLGGSFNFDLQSLTTLFLFYPGIYLEPYLLIDNPKRERRSVALIMPIDYYFRRDLGFYGSIAVGIVRRYSLK